MEQEKPDETVAEATVAATGSGSLDLVIDVPLRVTVEVGSASMLVREVLQFSKGSVVELDRAAGQPADVLVNGRLLARGEVTVEEDRLAVRIVEMLVEPPGS
ncbi:MAG: flagellar motor switch protein FliN [bacterium]|nr:flagellar motor switch protein FliN [bacterium]MCP5067389.1 flagellar motor switch protein FliN [bacterium]